MQNSYIVLYVTPVTFIEIIGVFTIFLLYFCYDCYYAFQIWFNYVYYISTFNIKLGPNILLCKINVCYVLKLNIHFSQIEKNTPLIISLYSSNNFVVGKTWVRVDRPGVFFLGNNNDGSTAKKRFVQPAYTTIDCWCKICS